MLEAVGHPVVVNPDRVLAKLARDATGDPGVHSACAYAPTATCAVGDCGGDRCSSAGSRYRCRCGGVAVSANAPAQRPEGRLVRILPEAPSAPFGSGVAEALGCSESEGNEDGEEDQFLHSCDPTGHGTLRPTPRHRSAQTVSRSLAPVSEEG